MQFEEFSANTYSYTQAEAGRRIAAAAEEPHRASSGGSNVLMVN